MLMETIPMGRYFPPFNKPIPIITSPSAAVNSPSAASFIAKPNKIVAPDILAIFLMAPGYKVQVCGFF